MNYDNRGELIEWLKHGVCTINFTKVDGTIRDMECTLNNMLLPKQTDIEEQIQKASTKSDSVIAVWDTVNNGWRSFRLDSVNYVIKGIK
jgi:hypothetical protein